MHKRMQRRRGNSAKAAMEEGRKTAVAAMAAEARKEARQERKNSLESGYVIPPNSTGTNYGNGLL
jgi:hypothetical protein